MPTKQIHTAGHFRLIELAAAGAISPGHLVRETSAGLANVHATDGGYAEKAVALEDALQGRTVDDAYAATDPVQIGVMAAGSTSQVIFKAGYAYAIGDLLVSKGDGTLWRYASSSANPKVALAVVIAALDLSASGAVDTLGLVRWL